MSDSKTPTRSAKERRRAPRGGTEALAPAAPLPKKADRIAGRHAAITNNLNDWGSYKSWAEKIREAWEEEK